MTAHAKPASSVTLTAAVMGRVLAIVDRGSPTVPVDTTTSPPAAVVDGVLILRCGGSYMDTTLHLERYPAAPSSTAAQPPDATGEHEHVAVTWVLPTGQLVVDQLHQGAKPVPDLGLHAGTWQVDAEVWGRDQAAALEARLDDGLESTQKPIPLIGPEVWRLRFWPVASLI